MMKRLIAFWKFPLLERIGLGRPPFDDNLFPAIRIIGGIATAIVVLIGAISYARADDCPLGNWRASPPYGSGASVCVTGLVAWQTGATLPPSCRGEGQDQIIKTEANNCDKLGYNEAWAACRKLLDHWLKDGCINTPHLKSGR